MRPLSLVAKEPCDIQIDADTTVFFMCSGWSESLDTQRTRKHQDEFHMEPVMKVATLSCSVALGEGTLEYTDSGEASSCRQLPWGRITELRILFCMSPENSAKKELLLGC